MTSRRELLKKLGLGALVAAPAMVVGVDTSPSGEFHLAASPLCPECGMVMDTSKRSTDGKVVFEHPARHFHGEWKCKAAGKKFYFPTFKFVEYDGEFK